MTLLDTLEQATGTDPRASGQQHVARGEVQPCAAHVSPPRRQHFEVTQRIAFAHAIFLEQHALATLGDDRPG